jgi:1,2-diacylglycerol 3-beta-glucosyltransferase
MLLPRIILLGLVAILIPVTLLFGHKTLIFWSASLMLCLMAVFYISTPGWLKSQIGWKEVMLLPKLFFKFIKSITKIGEARKKFIHTPHDSV